MTQSGALDTMRTLIREALAIADAEGETLVAALLSECMMALEQRSGLSDRG